MPQAHTVIPTRLCTKYNCILTLDSAKRRPVLLNILANALKFYYPLIFCKKVNIASTIKPQNEYKDNKLYKDKFQATRQFFFKLKGIGMFIIFSAENQNFSDPSC